jgi:AcrR family transcriptional regulator
MAARQTKAIRRIQIAEAAGKLITRHGSENLTIKGIAAEVGISEAAIYRHFRSKKEVLILLADHVRETLGNDIKEATLGTVDSLSTLENALKKHVASIERRRGISFQIISEIISLGDREVNEHTYRAIEFYVESLKMVLKQAAAQKAVKGDLDVSAIALCISSSIQGLVNTWVLSNFKTDIKADFASIWVVLLTGISVQS